MPVDVSKQVRHWRDRSPYPGASSSALSRNSTETYKPAEPVQPPTCIHSSQYTRTSPHQYDTEGMEVIPAYFHPEPVATNEPQTNNPIKRSVSWARESSPSYQKAAKARVRLARSSTLPLQREQEVHREMARVFSASPQHPLDAKGRPRLRIMIPERPDNSGVRQRSWTPADDGIKCFNLVPQRAWVQLDDGIRSPRLVRRDSTSYNGAPSMTVMVEKPEELDDIPPLSLGSSLSSIQGSFKQLLSRSSGFSATASDNVASDFSAKERDSRSEDSFAFVDGLSLESERVQQVKEDGSGESESEEEYEAYEKEYEAHQEEYEADEEEDDTNDNDEEKVKMVWYRADPCCRCDNCCPIKRMSRPRGRCLNAERIPVSVALRKEAGRKYRLGLKVFLGILVVLFLVLGANFYLASWENAIAKGKNWRSRP